MRCLQIMPVASRLDWIMRQILAGRGYHVGVGAALDASKFKVKITLHPERVGTPSRAAMFAASAMMDLLRSWATMHSAVDRGHKFSSGWSEVCIWFRLVGHAGNSAVNIAQHGVADMDGDDVADPYPNDTVRGTSCQPVATVVQNPMGRGKAEYLAGSVSLPLDIEDENDENETQVNRMLVVEVPLLASTQ